MVAFAHVDRPIAAVATVMARYEFKGNPIEPYRICLNFNPTNTVIWVDKDCFKNGDLEEGFLAQLKAADSELYERVGTHSLEFQEAKSKRKIDGDALLSALWP